MERHNKKTTFTKPSIEQTQSNLDGTAPFDSSKNLLFDKVKLSDIVMALNAKTISSALSWCKRKGLVVIKFGKERYVNLVDFQIELDRTFIDALKVKHPSNWAEVYQSYKKLDYAAVAEQNPSLAAKKKFALQGVAANAFMKKMKLNIKRNG